MAPTSPAVPHDIPAFALAVPLSLGIVPAFAPVGWDAASYASHAFGRAPLAEVQAWHEGHWRDITEMEGFAAYLDLAAWDPHAWARLATAASASRLLVRPAQDCDWSAHADGVDAAAKEAGLATELGPTAWGIWRGLGRSTAYNQIEEDGDQLDAAGIVDVLTATVARGGALTLAIGPMPDGSVPPHATAALELAGGWLRTHSDALREVDRFDVWGDNEVRYTATEGPEPGTRTVHAIDVTGSPTRELAHFSPHRYPIEAVDGAATWEQGPAGLRLVARPAARPAPGTPAATHYRLTVRAKRARSLVVTGERADREVRIGDRAFPSITAALAAAESGDEIELPAARFGTPKESFPLVVPAGVTVAAAEDNDPHAEPPTLDGSDLAPGTPLVELHDDAGLEGLVLIGPRVELEVPADPAVRLIVSNGAHRTIVDRCTVHGSITHDGGADHAVSFCRLLGGGVIAVQADRVTVTGNRITFGADHPIGALARGTAVFINGGREHRIDANTVDGVAVGILVADTTDTTIAANAATALEEAIRVFECEGTDLSGNQCRGSRGIAIHGGTDTHAIANIADGTDTGLLLWGRAGGTVATGNQFVGCRVGILSWSHHGSALDGNRFVECGTNWVH